MRLIDEIRVSGQLLATRAVLSTLAATGDPLATAASSTWRADPYPVFRQIRTRGPVVRSRLGTWVTASHAVASTVLRDSRFGMRNPDPPSRTSRHGAFDWPQRPPDVVPPIRESLLAIDPPDHTRLRRLLSDPFRPAALSARHTDLEKIAHILLDDLAVAGPVDLVTGFTAPFPVMTICQTLGIDPTRHEQFAAWGASIGTALGGAKTRREISDARAALLALNTFFDELISRRERAPSTDIVSDLVRARDIDGSLTGREVKTCCLLLFLAGFETMVNLLGNGVLALLSHPGQWRLLCENPHLVPAAVEELLRFDPPVQLTSRVAQQDVELGGVRIRRGTAVTILLGGANRDPEVFDEPDRLDVTRANARNHLAFSSGAHYCLGAPLARMEIEVALRCLLERLPGLTLAGRPVRVRTRAMRGLARLPVLRGGSHASE